MKYRIDADTQVNDRILAPGTEVGDGCDEGWRYPADAHPIDLRGKPRPPNESMTPLDDEAKKLWKETFPDNTPEERDPAQRVPITSDKRDAAGNHIQEKPVAPPGRPNPAPETPNEPKKLGEDLTKDPSLANEDAALNKTPVQHKPSESKPAGKA